MNTSLTSDHKNDDTEDVTSGTRQDKVRVWDPLVRIFHWSLVLSFSIAYLTGEDDSLWHINSGYVVLGLISFRLLWGIIGTKYARFSNFVTRRDKVLSYLKSMLKGKPEHYPGHNPAGGWMIIALLISLFVTSLSGLQLYAVEEGKGPFASDMIQNVQLIRSAHADDDDNREDDFWEEFWEEIHELAANTTLLLIFIHVAGVFVSGRLHKENLVKAMITGNKSSQ